MKILFVQYFFAPLHSNQSIREEIIINELKKDHSIDFLTSQPKNVIDNEVYNGINIYRVSPLFFKKDIKKGVMINTKSTFLKNTAKSILHAFMWPDFAFTWVYPAQKKALELYKVNKYDLVVSTSFPFSSHLVAMAIKKKHPKINWIVNYIDPYSIIKYNEQPSNNVFLYKKLNFWIEKKVNNLANKILIQEESYKGYQKYFKKYLHKVEVIPHLLGVNETLYNEINPWKYEEGYIDILFLGTLYKSIRNPEPMLSIFEKVFGKTKNVRLHIVGLTNDCDDLINTYMSKHPYQIIKYGKVDRVKAIGYLKGADILVNIGNDSTYQLPGKCLEYIYANKKILNFINRDNDTSTSFFNRFDSDEVMISNINTKNIEVGVQKTLDLIGSKKRKTFSLKKNKAEYIANKYYIV